MSMLEIQQAAADLSEQDRGVLAAWLLETLPPHSSEDAAMESLAEAFRRKGELDSGATIPVSQAELWQAVARERAA